jgi:hypothetical protein
VIRFTAVKVRAGVAAAPVAPAVAQPPKPMVAQPPKPPRDRAAYFRARRAAEKARQSAAEAK